MRAAWAASVGLVLAAILSRFSTKMQSSTDTQVRECVEWAARNRMYPPPELVCADEAVTGKKIDLAGLNRVKQILKAKLARALLVYKMSRLFRHPHLGFAFFNEHLVEEGLRGISVSQMIDTNDEKTWKLLAAVHGLADDMLLTATSDHVFSKLKDLFADGFVTGLCLSAIPRRKCPAGNRPIAADRGRCPQSIRRPML